MNESDWPHPLAHTNRFEFWNNPTSRGIVIIRRYDQSTKQIGIVASLILRQMLRYYDNDLKMLNEIGNTLFPRR